MGTMNSWESPLLVEAVLIWTGWRRDVIPRRDDSLLVHRFGAKLAAELLPVIKSIEDDFYSSDARFVAADFREMEKMASEQFKKKHPEVAQEIVQAFAWCYTYDYK